LLKLRIADNPIAGANLRENDWVERLYRIKVLRVERI